MHPASITAHMTSQSSGESQKVHKGIVGHRSRVRLPQQNQQKMAAYMVPPPPKDTIRVRQFNICQYDLLGSTQVCTAIAVVAAREFHRVAGRCDEIFKSDSQVMDILSEGVVWHSRWLALDTDGSRTAFEADTEGDDADPNLVSMATPDEICALPAMDMEVTDVRYEGTLIPQAGREHYGYSVTEAIKFIFNPPAKIPEDEHDHHIIAEEPSEAQSSTTSTDAPQEETTVADDTSAAEPQAAVPPRRPPPPAPGPRVGSPSSSKLPESSPDAIAEMKSAILKRMTSVDLSIFTKAADGNAAEQVTGTVTPSGEIIDTYIFTSRGYSTLMARRGNTTMVFDSHQRDKRGMANKEEGKAVCVFCDGPQALARYIRALYGTKPLSLFTLQQVVPKESTDKIQYGATACIVKPKPVTPPPPQPTSMGALASNAGNVAAARIAELGASFKRMSFFKEGPSKQ